MTYIPMPMFKFHPNTLHKTLSAFFSTRPAYNIVKPGKISQCQTVPKRINKPFYVANPDCIPKYYPSEELKSAQDIEKMRDAGVIASAILQYAGMLVKPGVTTDEIDTKVHEMIIKQNAYPSPLLYKGFPKSICTSVNNIACHGIPDDRELLDGDIVTIDVTVFFRGFHGDCSDTFAVGGVDSEAQLLIDVTRECRDEAIKLCGPGVPLSAIGAKVSEVSEAINYDVNKDMIGHGIGRFFHSKPEILHYRNKGTTKMLEGMTFTIEPILSEGSARLQVLEDNWSMSTVDDSRTAQCEHTILITEHGAEILTHFQVDSAS